MYPTVNKYNTVSKSQCLSKGAVGIHDNCENNQVYDTQKISKIF